MCVLVGIQLKLYALVKARYYWDLANLHWLTPSFPSASLTIFIFAPPTKKLIYI